MRTPESRRGLLALAGVPAIACALLAGCGTTMSATNAALPTISVTPGGSSPGAASGPAVGGAAVSTVTVKSPAGARGCARTSGGIPAKASHRVTMDVDSDGRRDTEWLTSSPDGAVRIGITTASGATFSVPWQSASPVERVVLVARPKPGAQPVILTDDGRMVGLFTVLRCAIRPVTNIQGHQYRFDLGFADTGTGVGCLGPGDLPGLTGLDLLPATDHKHFTITRTFVNVVGSKATNGRRDTLHITLPAGQAAVSSATAVTCGTMTIDHDGLAAPQQ